MNILITAIGSFSTDCVVSSLKREGHKVVGCDIYPSEWHPVSKDCDAVYQVPFATIEKEYIEALFNICKDQQIDLIFPLTDLEIDVLNKYRQEFEHKNVQLCIQSEFCLSIARNKYEMAKFFADDSEVRTPKTVMASDALDVCMFPAIAKPYNGRSSEGLLRLTTIDEVQHIQNRERYIIQEMLPGNVYTVDFVRDRYGNDFAVPREELLRTKNGAGTTVRVIPDKKLHDMASYIGAKLDIVGCVNMEFINNNGNYYLIDINPRFSAGVAFSNSIGYDMVLNHLRACLNKTIEKSVSYQEQLIAKRYKEEVLWVRK